MVPVGGKRQLDVRRLEIEDVILITPAKHQDARGFFSETYNKALLAAEAGITESFVQDNHSHSADVGTVRGMHFQVPPRAQDKLVRVLRGSVLDVVVDIRRGSPTFGRFVSAVLSVENWAQMWVPKGFAHGICTLEPNTEIAYKVTEYYSAEHEGGLAWDDPALGIEWPVPSDKAILADRDRQHPQLGALEPSFAYVAD